MTDARRLDDIGTTANPAISLVNAQSAANTAAASSGSGEWLNVTSYDGDILVVLNLGSITGSIAGKLQSATDVNGTSAADIVGATFAAGVANTPQAIVVKKDSLPAGSPFIGFIGTVVTGPVVLSVTAVGRKKYV